MMTCCAPAPGSSCVGNCHLSQCEHLHPPTVIGILSSRIGIGNGEEGDSYDGKDHNESDDMKYHEKCSDKLLQVSSFTIAES